MLTKEVAPALVLLQFISTAASLLSPQAHVLSVFSDGNTVRHLNHNTITFQGILRPTKPLAADVLEEHHMLTASANQI